MIQYFDNNQMYNLDKETFSYGAIGSIWEHIKTFNNTISQNVSFVVDIHNIDILNDNFFITFLGNNNIIFHTEHKINVEYFSQKLMAKIKQFQIDPKKIFVIIAHQNQLEPLKTIFIQNHLEHINILCSMMWLLWPYYRINFENFDFTSIKVDKRFSIFSRRYTYWRRNLYLDLLIRDILPNTTYTFSNLHPDIDDPKSLEQMLENLPDYMEDHKTTISNWFENDLYSINFDDPFNPQITKLMQKAAINIVLETHIIEQSNGVSLTEKTYKPILLKKPFLVYGIPNILGMLRENGFRTFHGIIDESYDSIQDENERRLAIIQEVDRLNKLDIDSFTSVLKQCESICEHNFEVFEYYKNRQLPDNFTNRYIFGSK